MLKHTPFHERTAPLCVSHAWRRWAGYAVASSYELSHEREYHSVRAAAALFDVSPLYKYSITGKDAARLLDHVVTRSIEKLAVGQVAYTPWCDARGKVLFGIRPEHLEPCPAGEAKLVVDVDLIEPLGADTLVYGHLEGGARVAARLHSSFAARAGKLPLRYDAAQAHYFDAGTGARL